MIKVKDLNKIYRPEINPVHALKDLNMEIHNGEFVAVMGPSGSGKSTLMNILGCLDTPSSGSYHLDGLEVSILDDEELARIRNQKIGFVFQNFNLLPRMSALRNVEIPMLYAGLDKVARREKAMQALERVGMAHRVNHKPNELSGGQSQRVAIARALVNQPPVLFADEPTGNLDSQTSEEIMAIFQELNRQGTTVVLVTHEANIAMHASRILHFLDGMLNREEYVNNQVISSITPDMPAGEGCGER